MKIILCSIITLYSIMCTYGQDTLSAKCDWPKVVSMVDTTEIDISTDFDLTRIKYHHFIDTLINIKEVQNKNVYYSLEYKSYTVILNNPHEAQFIFLSSNDSVYRYIKYKYKNCQYIDISLNSEESHISCFNCSYGIPNNCYEEEYQNDTLIVRIDYQPYKFVPEEIKKARRYTLNGFYKIEMIKSKISDGDGGWLIAE